MRYANLLSVAALMSLFLSPFTWANPAAVVGAGSAGAGAAVTAAGTATSGSTSGDLTLSILGSPGGVGIAAAVGAAAVMNDITKPNNHSSSDSSNSSSGSAAGSSAGTSAGASVGGTVAGASAGSKAGASSFLTKNLLQAIKAWQDRWVAEFNRLGQRMVDSKTSLAKSLEECARIFTVGSANHKSCSDRAMEAFEKRQAELEKLFAEAKAQAQKEYAALQKRVNAEVGIQAPDLNLSGGAAAAPITGENNGVCKINGVWQPCSGVGTSANPDLGAGVGVVNGTNVGVNTGTGTGTTTNTTTNTTTHTSTNSTANTSNSQSTTNNQTVNNVTNNYGIQEMPNIESMTDFCKANPKVLSCIEAGSGDPEPEGVVSSLIDTLKRNGEKIKNDFKIENILGSGIGACPQPVTFSILGSSIVMPYDLLCDFLKMLRPIVIASFAFVTMLFVLGRVK